MPSVFTSLSTLLKDVMVPLRQNFGVGDRMISFRRTFTAVLLAGGIGTAVAAEPADNIIKGALSDVARFEQQSQGLTAARKSNIRRILKLMTITRDRLDGSGNKSHESWRQADQRLKALRAQLEGLLAPAQAQQPSAKQPPAATDANPSAQPAQAQKPVQSGTNTGNAQQTDVRPLVSGERVRVKKLARDIANVRNGIVTEGPSHLQAPDNFAKLKKRFDQFTTALKRYPQLDDPDVQTARREYQALSEAATTEVARAKAQLAQLGNVQERLAKIDAVLRGTPLPESLSAPFSRADADQWVAAARELHPLAEQAKKELEQMAPIAYLPSTVGVPPQVPYDRSDLESLYGYADSQLKNLGRRLTETTAALDRAAEDTRSRMATINSHRDPTNARDLWVYLEEGKREEMHRQLDEMRLLVSSGVHFYEALGRETPAVHQNALDAVEEARTRFERSREIALSSSKLPDAASKDPALLTIAEETLARPDYEIGEHERLVINADLTSYENKSSEIDIDKVDLTLSGDLKLSGTQTTWTYKWDQFQVATAERQADGRFYVWYTTLKKFSSGGPTTPLNKWIVSGRFKQNEILEENLGE